ncbi:RICIN domain-containing protein [Streptomyces cynarae]|uniref:RICIN domain-containing protein n=1 Tax=Streptomyces cynarae TaxID=2981134 RepID=UPI00406C51A3
MIAPGTGCQDPVADCLGRRLRATEAKSYTSSTATSQRWTLTSAGGGYYKLVNGGSGLLAGVAQSSTANGASVIQWNDVGVDDQLWQIVRVN